MTRIAIGKTGLKINRLGFGGIPIARVDENQAVETVLHAVESGVDFIDTARNYKTSERRIGMALQQTNRRVVLASKSQGRTAIDKARNCSECGECLERCPYQLPIPDLIKENLAWVDEQFKP